MNTLHSLTRRLEKLQAGALAQHAPPTHAVILYDMHRPDREVWLEEEKARVLAQGAGYIKTIILMPEQETTEQNAARYATIKGNDSE